MSADQPLPDADRDDGPSPAAQPRKARGQTDRDVGAALRTVYQRTVDEKVPDEFLDLLGKLG